MSLSELIPSMPWIQRGKAMPSTTRKVICERIICVHDKNSEIGWWHDLEQDNELAFADGGRITESDLDGLAAQVEEAVQQGYRPLVFIDGLENWPKTMTALGRHQAFGRIYARGRDDALICELLHGPSVDIVDIYREGGFISVPNLTYGQALDTYLSANLEDFYLVDLDDSDPLELTLKLVSRLNQLRRIDAKVYCRNGIVRMSQWYRSDEIDPTNVERCDLPLRYKEWLLDFSSSNPLKSSEFAGNEIAFMEAFSKMLGLPTEYRGWESGHESPWKGLLKSLLEMSRGVIQQLTISQAALLARVDLDTIRQGIESLEGTGLGSQPGYAAVRGVLQKNTDDTAKSIKPQKQSPFVLLRNTKDTSVLPDSNKLKLEVQWVYQDPPAVEPDVVVELAPEGGILSGVSVQWSNNFQQITLSGIKSAELRMGWVWLPKINKLKISIASDGH